MQTYILQEFKKLGNETQKVDIKLNELEEKIGSKTK